MEAFAAAAAVSPYQDTHEDLFPAYSACTGIDEWKAADTSHPAAIDGVDPVQYAMSVCAGNQSELGETPICKAVNAPPAGSSSLEASGRAGLLGVPLPEGAQLTERTPGDPENYVDPREAYAISATASDIAAFFGRAMPESGWFKHGVSTEKVLFFQKGNLMPVIIIGDGKFSLMGESDPSTSPVAGSSISEDRSVTIEPNMSEDNRRDAASITDVAFELKWTEAGNDHVVIFLESNLPDNAQVRISARRLYDAVTDGRRDTYSLDYFSEEGSLGQWSDPRQVSVDREQWRLKLLEHQNAMARLGTEMAFEIYSIENDINILAYVYAHKTGDRYGAREYNDVLDRVNNTDLVASSEIQVRHPLITEQPISRLSPIAAYDELEYGETYRTIRADTPLMPSLQERTLEDLVGAIYLPDGTLIKVEAVTRVTGDFWYNVSLPQVPGGKGWINSIAFIADGVERVSSLIP